MDDRISLDIYVSLKNPHFRVDFAEDTDRVEVTFGGPSFHKVPLNMLNMWFTDPQTVLDLAQELCVQGTQFLLAQQAAADDGGEREEYPVPLAKPKNDKREDDD